MARLRIPKDAIPMVAKHGSRRVSNLLINILSRSGAPSFRTNGYHRCYTGVSTPSFRTNSVPRLHTIAKKGMGFIHHVFEGEAVPRRSVPIFASIIDRSITSIRLQE